MVQHAKETGKAHWAKIPGESDIYVNCVCTKCEKKLVKEFNFVISQDGAKIYCDTCASEIIEKNHVEKVVKASELNKSIICEILERPNVTKFIHGKDLYITFSIIVRNYRNKVEFCNY